MESRDANADEGTDFTLKAPWSIDFDTEVESLVT